jgi:hypothetical protein
MRTGLLLVTAVISACAEIDSPSPKMVLPPDYRTAFAPVLHCGTANEHLLGNKAVVRMHADLAGRFENGPYPYPEGTLIVKEEYPVYDDLCANLTGYTVMRKEASGYSPTGGDWQWFSLDSLGTVLKEGKQPTCVSCHDKCNREDQRDFTCFHNP